MKSFLNVQDLGCLSQALAEAREIIRDSFDVKVYEAKHSDAWDEAYHRYLSICKEV